MAAIDDLMRGIIEHYLHPVHQSTDMSMTVGQMECLRLIENLNSPTMSALATRLQLSRSSVTAVVDALVARGMVQRVQDADDRRYVRVQLTEDGKNERARHLQIVSERFRALLGDFDDDKLIRIHLTLSLVHQAAVEHSRRDNEPFHRVDGEDRGGFE